MKTLTERLEEDFTDILGRAKAAPTGNAGQPTPGRTYAAAVMAVPPPEHAAAVASSTTRTRQILIERAPNMQDWMAGLSPKDIVEKARMVVVLMSQEARGPAPAGTTFVGATPQRSGAVLLHLNTKQAADWIKDNMSGFLAALGGTSVYKERLLNVVVKYVPVSFDPSRDGALHEVEGDNGLPSGTLVKARWIKPVEQRREGQKVAHAVFGFKDPAAANAFLQAGLWVEGKRVHGRKLLTEPIRCMKCQGIGLNHVAATCDSIHDVCARCGEIVGAI
ncbi:hypothetical protein B0H11DRAFT_1758944 [Mycena galericulata]|nr:hypothetical protein B0H11DRAFT_1758944 [Mycena galericulata]